jgi:hypothetical protein
MLGKAEGQIPEKPAKRHTEKIGRYAACSDHDEVFSLEGVAPPGTTTNPLFTMASPTLRILRKCRWLSSSPITG